MGIYSDGHVYGVRFVLNGDILFEATYDHRMTPADIQHTKTFYDTRTLEDKDAMDIRFYTLCSSTYTIGVTNSFASWVPGNKALLEKLLNEA